MGYDIILGHAKGNTRLYIYLFIYLWGGGVKLKPLFSYDATRSPNLIENRTLNPN